MTALGQINTPGPSPAPPGLKSKAHVVGLRGRQGQSQRCRRPVSWELAPCSLTPETFFPLSLPASPSLSFLTSFRLVELSVVAAHLFFSSRRSLRLCSALLIEKRRLISAVLPFNSNRLPQPKQPAFSRSRTRRNKQPRTKPT